MLSTSAHMAYLSQPLRNILESLPSREVGDIWQSWVKIWQYKKIRGVSFNIITIWSGSIQPVHILFVGWVFVDGERRGTNLVLYFLTLQYNYYMILSFFVVNRVTNVSKFCGFVPVPSFLILTHQPPICCYLLRNRRV